MSIASTLGLEATDAVVLQNSNKLALHLRPCGVFSRVALIGQEVARFEVELAQRLAALNSPVAALEPRVDQRTYERDGFAVTLWTYYPQQAAQLSAQQYAEALVQLHVGMRRIEIPTPHFSDRVAEAVKLVSDHGQTPGLSNRNRTLLVDTLTGLQTAVADRRAPEQLLHGEPHSGNVLNTVQGPLFIDLETCCRGPIEFDVAHTPMNVAEHYPGIDRELLDQCRGLVMAMVAAWRWDAEDQFPNRRRMAWNFMRIVRKGPPWPTLDLVG